MQIEVAMQERLQMTYFSVRKDEMNVLEMHEEMQ